MCKPLHHRITFLFLTAASMGLMTAGSIIEGNAHSDPYTTVGMVVFGLGSALFATNVISLRDDWRCAERERPTYETYPVCITCGNPECDGEQ